MVLYLCGSGARRIIAVVQVSHSASSLVETIGMSVKIEHFILQPPLCATLRNMHMQFGLYSHYVDILIVQSNHFSLSYTCFYYQIQLYIYASLPTQASLLHRPQGADTPPPSSGNSPATTGPASACNTPTISLQTERSCPETPDMYVSTEEHTPTH